MDEFRGYFSRLNSNWRRDLNCTDLIVICYLLPVGSNQSFKNLVFQNTCGLLLWHLFSSFFVSAVDGPRGLFYN